MTLTARAKMPYPLRKAWMVMRLTGFILLFTALHLSAKTSAQQITLSSDGMSMEQFFNELHQQSGYSFLLENGIIDRPVRVHVTHASLETVLNMVLQPLSLTFRIESKMVYIIKAVPVLSAADSSFKSAPPGDVHGRVTDSLGKPLSGASVIVKGKGKQKGTETDVNGYFSLSGVPENATLVISYTGYTSRQYKITSNVDFTVLLDKSNNPLDQVQVIAYGTTTQRLSTGDVTTVTSKEIEQQPVANPLLALEGRVPGLFITQGNGLPGSGVTVQIRGQNSIANGNDPFYVIDGVPYTSQLLPTNLGSGILGNSSLNFGNGGNPMSFINPSDIESISVLKDAVATAIYGSRAANGAILITTKKGKAGQTKVDANIQNGWGQVTRKLDLMNTQQYLQMRHEAMNNDGSTIGTGDYDLNGTWDTTRYTDWQKQLIGGTAQYTNANVSISGAGTNTQYLISGTYHRETTVFPGEFDDQKGALHFNLSSSSTNQKFHIQFSGNYMVDNNQLPENDLTSQAITLAPVAPPLFNPDGSLNWAPTSSGASTWQNPLSYLYNHYSNKTKNLVSNAVLRYQILPGLEIQSSFGYTDLQSNDIVTVPQLSYKPEQRAVSPRSAEYSNNDISSWIIEPQISYKLSRSKGRLEALVGTTIEQNNSNGEQLYGYGFNSDQVMGNIAAAPFTGISSTTYSVYKYNAAFCRIDYTWDNKYLVDLTARRDGSSRFGPANQFHDFGAIGLGWVFSEEDFFKKNLPGISFGKLRASYGTTGNDQIGDYRFLNLYTSTYAGIAYQGAVGLQPSGLPNPYLQWEETKKLEAGTDLGFFKDRILLNASYYLNRSGNQLLNYPLPAISGSSSITANLAATVQNSGWEFTLGTVNMRSAKFEWSTHINLTIPQNKLIAFPDLASSSFAGSYQVGQPITTTSVFHLIGVNDSTGIYQFATSKGVPTYNPVYGTDNTVIINISPKLYGGFQNNFRYKGFELDILFSFVEQKGLNYFFGNLPGSFEGGQGNNPVYLTNRWQKPSDKAAHQQYNSNFSLFQPWATATVSDAAWTDASYIRLKNLSLSWQLPENWRSGAHLQSARIYMQGQNLLTITHYAGMDPETRSTSSLPPLRVLTFGIQVTF